MRRGHDRLLRALLHWTAVTTLVFWLALIRSAFDGSTYVWALGGGIGGRGLQGDLWVLLLGTAYAITLLWLGWRGARQPFHWMLLAWHLALAAGVTYLAVTRPDGFTFRGDTLGLEFSLAFLGPILFGGFALLAIHWVIRDLRSRDARPVTWTKENRNRALLLLALIPVQFVLLRFGEPHGTTDAIGVVVTIVQWLGWGWAVKPAGAPAIDRSD